MTFLVPRRRDPAGALPRRRLLRLFVTFCAVLPAAALAGCANRQELSPERRSRGRAGRGEGQSL